MFIENLKKLDLFSEVALDKLQQIANFSSVKKLLKGNVLFYQDEKPKFVYGLLDGSIKLSKRDHKDNEIQLRTFCAPSIIAEMAAIEDMAFPATSEVTSNEATILMIQRDCFIDMIKSDAQFSFSIIKSLTKKVKTLENVINQNIIFDANTNVLNYIKNNEQAFSKKRKIQIANELNIAPETLSRILKKLKEKNIINEKNQIINLN